MKQQLLKTAHWLGYVTPETLDTDQDHGDWAPFRGALVVGALVTLLLTVL